MEPPRTDDHWHAAYALYDCDAFLGPFSSAVDPDGIHSHQDGVVHIHPWNSSATGKDARLEVFFDAMGVRVTDNEISGPGIGVLKAGSDCGGEPTVIRAVRFGVPNDFDRLAVLNADLDEAANLLEGGYAPMEEFTEDFGKIRLLRDLEAFTIARVPADAVVPVPPTDRIVTAFRSSAGGLLSQGPSNSAVPAAPSGELPENSTSDADTSDADGGDADAADADTSDADAGDADAADAADGEDSAVASDSGAQDQPTSVGAGAEASSESADAAIGETSVDTPTGGDSPPGDG